MIDFGTSYTVAVGKQAGRSPEVIEIGGERRVPSVVAVESGGDIIAGRAADDRASSNPGSTLRAPKTRLGDQAPVVLAGRTHQIVDLVAELLRSVYNDAVRQMESPPDEVRLTHPATWNAPRLSRLLESAAKAGLRNCSLVPEPVAAALSYASEVGVAEGSNIAVYDLGGGTFDTAVVTGSGGRFTLAGRPGGDQTIGGDLFDEILYNAIGEKLPPDAWDSIVVDNDPRWRTVAESFRREVRSAKERLSTSTYTDVSVPLPTGLFQYRLQRTEFEDLIRSYLDETITLLRRCISEAGVSEDSLAAIYLVGGSSRSPIVESMVRAAFPNLRVSRRGDPKTAVALGAAQAERSNPPTDPGLALPISPTPLGLPPTAAPISVPPAPAPPVSVPPAAPVPAPPVSVPPATPVPPPISVPPVSIPPAPRPAPLYASAPGGPPAAQYLQPGPSPQRRSQRTMFTIVGVAVAAVASVVAVIVLRGGDDKAAVSTTTETTFDTNTVADTTGPVTTDFGVTDSTVATTTADTATTVVTDTTAVTRTTAGTDTTGVTSTSEFTPGGAADIGHNVLMVVPDGWTASKTTSGVVSLVNGATNVDLQALSRKTGENPAAVVEEYIGTFEQDLVISYGPTFALPQISAAPELNEYGVYYVIFDAKAGIQSVGGVYVFQRDDGLTVIYDVYGADGSVAQLPDATYQAFLNSLKGAPSLGTAVPLVAAAPERIKTSQPLVAVSGLIGFRPTPGFETVSTSDGFAEVNDFASGGGEDFSVVKQPKTDTIDNALVAAEAQLKTDDTGRTFGSPKDFTANSYGVLGKTVSWNATAAGGTPVSGYVNLYFDPASGNSVATFERWNSSADGTQPRAADFTFMNRSVMISFNTID